MKAPRKKIWIDERCSQRSETCDISVFRECKDEDPAQKTEREQREVQELSDEFTNNREKSSNHGNFQPCKMWLFW